MLARRVSFRKLAPLALVLLVYGCSGSNKSLIGIPRVGAEADYYLYKSASLPLAELPPGTNADTFWVNLAAHASSADHDNISLRITKLTERILRVERSVSGKPVAVHFSIYAVRSGNRTAVELQPIIAWRPAVGGGGAWQLVLAANADATLQALKAELPPLARAAI